MDGWRERAEGREREVLERRKGGNRLPCTWVVEIYEECRSFVDERTMLSIYENQSYRFLVRGLDRLHLGRRRWMAGAAVDSSPSLF